MVSDVSHSGEGFSHQQERIQVVNHNVDVYVLDDDVDDVDVYDDVDVLGPAEDT